MASRGNPGGSNPRGKLHAIDAPREAWERLGRLLRDRRGDLGYPNRRHFEKARKISYRRLLEIENASRPDPSSWGPETLKDTARIYEVEYKPMLAVLRGEADELVPAAPASAGAVRPAGDPRSPLMMDRAREAAVRPLYDEILGRLLGTADKPGIAEELGIPVSEVTGTQLFGAGTPDAKDWDDPRTRRLFSVRERVWMIAEMRVREGSHNQSEAGSALAAPMMNVMAGP